MPLYVVRWPGLQASLVRARDEDDLLDKLDEVSDPGGCTYKVYKGPVWVDFTLPFTIRDVTPHKRVPTEPADFTVDADPEFDGDLNPTVLKPEMPGADSAYDMCAKVLQFAFPSLFRYMERRDEQFDDTDDAEPPKSPERYPESLRAALVADLMPLVRDCQAVAALQERDDLEARLMKNARVTVMLPAMRHALAHALEVAVAKKAD